MKKIFNEGNQIHNIMSSSGSGTVINYGSGSQFLTSYGSGSGSGSTSQKVTVPTVPVPVLRHCLKQRKKLISDNTVSTYQGSYLKQDTRTGNFSP
jgi:hypothetical protein